MNTHRYVSRPAGLVGPAYCDTSFVLDLFAHANPNHMTQASRASKQRATDAHAFYDWARLQGVDFYMSILVIEEAYGKLLFGPITQHLSSSRSGYRSWKELRNRDPAAFQSLITQGRQAVGTFQRFLQGIGIALITFGRGRFAGTTMNEHRICRYARAVLSLYETDAMDAFHYAIMRRCGWSLAIASDRDWTQFPIGTLVTAA